MRTLLGRLLNVHLSSPRGSTALSQFLVPHKRRALRCCLARATELRETVDNVGCPELALFGGRGMLSMGSRLPLLGRGPQPTMEKTKISKCK